MLGSCACGLVNVIAACGIFVLISTFFHSTKKQDLHLRTNLGEEKREGNCVAIIYKVLMRKKKILPFFMGKEGDCLPESIQLLVIECSLAPGEGGEEVNTPTNSR